MEKISNAVYNEANRDELISILIANQNEIVEWINEREKNNRHKLTVDDWKKLGGGERASQGSGK